MSNWKRAYGWYGHILLSEVEDGGDADANAIAIPAETFDKLVTDYNNDKLDPRISCEQIGVLDSDCIFLAAGVHFSKGFEYYGGPFAEAEAREGPHPVDKTADSDYLLAMHELYGLSLPPCRCMIGCSVEH